MDSFRWLHTHKNAYAPKNWKVATKDAVHTGLLGCFALIQQENERKQFFLGVICSLGFIHMMCNNASFSSFSPSRAIINPCSLQSTLTFRCKCHLNFLKQLKRLFSLRGQFLFKLFSFCPLKGSWFLNAHSKLSAKWISPKLTVVFKLIILDAKK